MKDITFPTFTVAKYIDPWTSWVPACSQTQVLFIVGILSLLTFNSAYHCRVLAVSLIFTHCTMVILEWTFMDPWTSWISYVSSIYISLFHRSSELWLKVSRPVSLTLLFIGLIGTAGVFLRSTWYLFYSHIVTWSYCIQPFSARRRSSTMYIMGQILSWCDMWSETEIPDM